MKNILKRGLVYETIVFIFAVLVAWILFGIKPWTSIKLTVFITVCKYPLYYLFHNFLWRDK